MGKRLRMMSGAAMGATIQYLYDPTSGRSRRARLRDQAAARLRKVTKMIGQKIRYQRGRLRGAAHDMSTGWKFDDHNRSEGAADLHEVRTAGNSRSQ